MKGVFVFLFLIIGLASASVISHRRKSIDADGTFLTRQKNLLQLFYHPYQPIQFKDQFEIGRTYSIQANKDKYDDPQAVDYFLHVWRQGMLPKGKIFSIMYRGMAYETEALYELFEHAKDFDTFYKTACWARTHINEGMFLYALTVAMVHRPDCKDFIFPTPFEIEPHYFFTSDVIDTAYKIKMQQHGEDIDDVKITEKMVHIYSNYSRWDHSYHEEQKMAYLTEDIGWNTFYYNVHLDTPYWMDMSKSGITPDVRGSAFIFLYRQLLARYYLERLSNGLGEIKSFSWWTPIETPYDPQLTYHNGEEFPNRPVNFDPSHMNHDGRLEFILARERRLRDAVDQSFVIARDGSHMPLKKPEDIGLLGNILQCNRDNPNWNYYGQTQYFSRMLLGNSPPTEKHNYLPSCLQHFQTTLRDPVFYQLAKRALYVVREFEESLPPYTRNEIGCPGVKVSSVQVDQLTTYFDEYETDIFNAVYHTPKEAETLKDEVEIYTRQHRLNHKPFTVTINLDSETSTKVAVRIFLGPKYDSFGDIFHMGRNRENFYIIDHFVYEAQNGPNVISRKSKDFRYTRDDWPHTMDEYRKMVEALETKKPYKIDIENRHDSIPDRLILPIGRKGGMPFYLYVIATPYNSKEVHEGNAKYLNPVTEDGQPFWYPFDRPVDEEVFRTSPNMQLTTVYVFHTDEEEMNLTKQH